MDAPPGVRPVSPCHFVFSFVIYTFCLSVPSRIPFECCHSRIFCVIPHFSLLSFPRKRESKMQGPAELQGLFFPWISGSSPKMTGDSECLCPLILSFPLFSCHSRGSGNPKCRDPQNYKDCSFPGSPGQARR